MKKSLFHSSLCALSLALVTSGSIIALDTAAQPEAEKVAEQLALRNSCFQNLPELTTSKVTLRKIAKQDASVVFKLLQPSPETHTLVGSLSIQGLEQLLSSGRSFSGEEVEQIIDVLFVQSAQQGQPTPWLVQDLSTKQVVGLAGMSGYDVAQDAVSYFALFNKSHENAIPEMEKEIFNYMFNTVGFEHVITAVQASQEAVVKRFDAYGCEKNVLPHMINFNIAIPRDASEEQIKEMGEQIVQRLRQEQLARNEQTVETFVYVMKKAADQAK